MFNKNVLHLIFVFVITFILLPKCPKLKKEFPHFSKVFISFACFFQQKLLLLCIFLAVSHIITYPV